MKNNKQKITFQHIHIPKPCHEDWEAMSSAERGRFCASCEKEVYDFTDGDEQKLRAAWESQDGNMCGRFRKKDITDIEIKSHSKIPPFIKTKLYQIAFGILAFTSSQSVFGKDIKPQPYEHAIIWDDLIFEKIDITFISGDICYPEADFTFSPLEENTPKEAEEESPHQDRPAQSPIIPTLNRMPIYFQKREDEGEDEMKKTRKRAW